MIPDEARPLGGHAPIRAYGMKAGAIQPNPTSVIRSIGCQSAPSPGPGMRIATTPKRTTATPAPIEATRRPRRRNGSLPLGHAPRTGSQIGTPRYR